MFVFWVVAGVLSAAAAGLILFRAAGAASRGEPVDPTPWVYRRQLAEIDELAERGLIGEGERRGAHAEAGRRLLAAADKAGEPWGAEPPGRGAVMLTAVLAPALALALYFAVGAPGMGDQPFAARLKTWQEANPATLSPPELAAVLKQVLRQRPDDVEGLRYLAIAEGASQNAGGAVRALRRAVRIAPERADLWEMLGEALIFEADGQVSPDARLAFQEALKRDPQSVGARFHLARGRIASGDRAGGLADWRALLADMPADDPRRAALESAIVEAEQGQARPAVPAPQIAAIRGMVEGLAERLRTKPDDPEGWVRLVRSYAVLGETTKRDAALAQARAHYATQPDVLNQLAQAARAEPMR
jgi:cytochrome c-type biogenesis protein CcmH